MDVKALVQRLTRPAVSATSVIVTVLIASVGVATVLASQAIAAARQRQAVSETMLREYAQLAAWEFSREARKDIDATLMRTLAAHVHPDRQMGGERCDCAPFADVEYWFEISPDGPVTSASGALPPDLSNQIARAMTLEPRGAMEGGFRIVPLRDDETRVVAVRWEPHAGARGKHIGLVTTAQALTPVLRRTHSRTALLPPLLAGDRDARTLVHLRVSDHAGRTVFSSPDTTVGPHVVETALSGGATLGLRVNASMTPAFVAGLGPEHGAGPSTVLVIGLVVVNGLLVAIGLWQLRRERELARLRVEFVAGVSHELRTPLAQIRMFAETLLLERIRNPYEGRRALEIIGQETRRLSQLVENVLYFHRHRRAPLPAPAEAVDLVGLVRDVADGFQPLAASRRARIDCTAAADEVVVHANPDGLRQVLLNLLDNAVKFGPAGQSISVSVTVVDDCGQIEVVDQGPGVPGADRGRIFEAFERGRTTNGAGGVGIGLAVVRQIVEAHGGHVSVQPGRERGAQFVVRLPMIKTTSRETTPVSLAG
jgi:signal transduction histidine kinase